jgi:hypothetical protein
LLLSERSRNEYHKQPSRDQKSLDHDLVLL